MEHRFYLGIDLDDQYAVISSYELNKKEPETFSAIAGSEIYQIPAPVSYTHLSLCAASAASSAVMPHSAAVFLNPSSSCRHRYA